MTDKPNDGGPAFPIETTATPYAAGLSIRDWFAGQALAGFMAGYFANPESGGLGFSEIAESVFGQADAMIAERNKPC